MQILLANPRGFCAGVDRAIQIVERALTLFGAPLYVRHEVVHNQFVVDDFKLRGVVFTDDLNDVPDNATLIFSAHGVSPAIREQAKRKNLKVFDATCPLVTKVHMEVARYAKEGMDCIFIGHKGHPEVEGTMGHYRGAKGSIYLVETEADANNLQVQQPTHLAFATQTTLSSDDTTRIVRALQERFPVIHGPRREDICYATQNRQDAVKDLSLKADVILVVGSKTSSNSNRLCEVATTLGKTAYLIDEASDINANWLQGVTTIGLTAGASAPDVLVQRVIAKLKQLGATSVQELQGQPENMVFSLPPSLRTHPPQSGAPDSSPSRGEQIN